METAPDSLSSSFLQTGLINVTLLSHRSPSPVSLDLTGGAPNRSPLRYPRAQNGQLLGGVWATQEIFVAAARSGSLQGLDS